MKAIALLGLAAASNVAAETIVGVYMFHRHGDRTPKILAPTNLTDLGYHEVYKSGQYYRSRYISSPNKIMGVSEHVVNLEQIAASSPVDNVLQSSAEGFLQGLYPPVGKSMSTQTLADGQSVSAPMNGYQIIPVNIVESGTGSENSGWLQDSTTCYNAEISSNSYFFTEQYKKLLKSSMGLYQKVLPKIEPVFNSSTATYLNAYTIFDYLNVARIHNSSQHDRASPGEFDQLRKLANEHEYNLAYNASSEIRAIAGSQLAAEIVDYLSTTIETQGDENKFGIQFGAYGTFTSFFGLSQLNKVDPMFKNVVGYASAMTFELYTNEDNPSSFPSANQLRVRFLFHDGPTTPESTPMVYPLFGTNQMSMSWADFKTNMHKFSVGTTRHWCHACGNTTGTCAPFSSEPVKVIDSGSGSGGLSGAVCGVIGAMVTLAVILLIELVILLAGGFTIVSKKRMRAGRAVANGAK